MQESILRFECLYEGFAGFDYVVQHQEFDYLFNKATRPCDMLQKYDGTLLTPAMKNRTIGRMSMMHETLN